MHYAMFDCIFEEEQESNKGTSAAPRFPLKELEIRKLNAGAWTE